MPGLLGLLVPVNLGGLDGDGQIFYGEDFHGGAATFQLSPALWLHDDVLWVQFFAFEQRKGVGADEDLVGFADFFNAFGRVHRVADSRIIHQDRGADIADHGFARVQADAHR